MSITKRKGSTFYWYSFSIDGERFRGSTFTANKKLAGEFETKIRNEAYSQRKLGRKQDVTLENLLARYWTEHAQSQSWAASVWGYMRNFTIVWGAKTYLSEITDAKYSELINYLKKKGLSASTINRHTECFRKACTLAKDNWGYEATKVRFSSHRLKQPDSRVRYLTNQEAVKLIDCAAPHLKPIIKFALYTGVRKQNILDLKWREVDMVGRRITFKVKSHMPGGKNHMVDMVEGLYDLLKSLPRESDHVFNYRGNRLTDNVKKAFKSACKRAGISDFRFHDLRHTCASWLVQDGTPIEVVREILGHTDIKTTLKYAHHHNERKLEAMQNTFKGRVGI